MEITTACWRRSCVISLIKGLGRFEGVVLWTGKQFSDWETEECPLCVRGAAREACPSRHRDWLVMWMSGWEQVPVGFLLGTVTSQGFELYFHITSWMWCSVSVHTNFTKGFCMPVLENGWAREATCKDLENCQCYRIWYFSRSGVLSCYILNICVNPLCFVLNTESVLNLVLFLCSWLSFSDI